MDVPSSFIAIQQGTNLFASWIASPQSNLSELWQSDVAGPNGNLVRVAQTPGTTYSGVLNSASTANIITNNPGAESGDLSGFPTFTSWTISSVDKYSGTYSFLTTLTNVASEMDTVTYAVTGGKTLTLTFWHKITVLSGSTLTASITETTAAGVDTTTVLTTLSATDASWTQSSATIILGASSVKLKVVIKGLSASGSLTAYIDDISLTGIVSTGNLFYAARGINSISGEASPFTSWLQPVQQAIALGIPSSDHMQEDYANARYRSSSFISGGNGSHIGTDGVDGFLIPPGSRLITFSNLR